MRLDFFLEWVEEAYFLFRWEKEKKINEFRKNERDMAEKLRRFGILKDKKEEDGNGDDGQKKDVVDK